VNIIHLDTVDSTNLYARSHFREFSPTEITCIYAETQTAGRGRWNRPWISPRSDNIYATFAFQLSATTLHLTSLAQLMTVSLARVLIQEGLYPKIKWPNDVQLSGKKVSGVLCETRFVSERVEIFLGVGVNVNMTAEELAQIDQKATSLLEETGRIWNRNLLLEKLQRQFLVDLERFKKEGFAPFHAQMERLLAYRGESVHCFDGKKEWIGICHSLTKDGQLNLSLSDGTIHTVNSGELRDC
jgi:BirA family transcriptional regulator, biotin operon repressor / biotin---[acetyl-CoA-carboxylase] ligase